MSRYDLNSMHSKGKVPNGGFKTPSKARWRRCRASQNAHPPEADCIFSSAGALPSGLINVLRQLLGAKCMENQM